VWQSELKNLNEAALRRPWLTLDTGLIFP